jgi:hypothetical protein
MAESNVREILDADKAYERWMQSDQRVGHWVGPTSQEAFRAGWQACIHALIEVNR